MEIKLFIEELFSSPSLAGSGNPQEIHTKLTTYKQIVEKFAHKFNMISHNDLENIWFRHFQDSLMPVKLFTHLFSNVNNFKSIDIGSGAGFPGIVLSILFPQLNITLLESNHKKCEFIEKDVISSLGLKNVKIVCDRSENIARESNHREMYDLVFERALAKPAVAIELLLPFSKIGGHSVFWASGQDWEKIEDLNKVSSMLGGAVAFEEKYILPNDESKERKIVVVEKIAHTDQYYPRRTGIPQKRPLK